MSGESGSKLSIIHELPARVFQGDEMEGESGFSRSIIYELHS